MKICNNKNIHSLQGFTLIELIIVIILLGIIGAIASTRLTDISSNMRVSSAINQIISDIELTKELALAKSSNMTITFDINLEEYTIRENGSLVIDYPGSENGVIKLTDGIFSSTDLTSVNLNGSNIINFDKWGNVLNSGTILLNEDYTISVSKLSGVTQLNQP